MYTFAVSYRISTPKSTGEEEHCKGGRATNGEALQRGKAAEGKQQRGSSREEEQQRIRAAEGKSAAEGERSCGKR